MYFKPSDDTAKSIHKKRESLIKDKKEIEQTIGSLVPFIGVVLKQFDPHEIPKELEELRGLLRRNSLILKQCITSLDDLKYQQNNNQSPRSEPSQMKPKM